MKKQRLQADFSFDFDVIGVVSAFKEHKLAWSVNQTLKIKLRREKDLVIKFIDQDLVIATYKYSTENSYLRLLRNRGYDNPAGENQLLIPELPQMDYFIMLQGMEPPGIIKSIRQIKGVDFAHAVDVESLKSRENFIF